VKTPAAHTPDRPIDTWLADHGEGLVASRRHLHAHPELSGEERATTEYVAERLELAGLTPRPLSCGTGVVCDIDPPVGETPDHGLRLLLRADLDALAMIDEKTVSYRSQVPGVAHACGHDVHTTIMLGAAVFYAHHREQLAGPVRFVFQPAEERVPGGALEVLADRVLDGAGAVIGLHCEPKLDVGTIGLRAGPISSAADMVTVRLTGPGGHTARPELTVDLLAAAARLITDAPVLLTSLVGDLGEAKMVFGAVNGGLAANAIPTTCELRASIRTPSPEVWERLPALAQQALRASVDGTGATVEIDYTIGVPPVVNDPDFTAVVHRAAETVVGANAVVGVPQSWGGDDFAWYTRELPGAYARLGTHRPGSGPPLDLHAGRFDVDERAIEVGVRLVAAVVDQHFSASTR
jgi:amidohydrolase